MNTFNIERLKVTAPDDPKIREVTARMSRFVCGLETERERGEEKAYIVETETPLVFSRYTPDRVTAEKNVYLITRNEKNGSRIFLVPGVIALIMFIRAKGDENTAKELQKELQAHFTRLFPGAYAEGNDVLIGGKKIMGVTVIYNPARDTVMARYMLTFDAGYIAGMTGEADFADRKYEGITGVCDETGLSPGEVREAVEQSVNVITARRRENAGV